MVIGCCLSAIIGNQRLMVVQGTMRKTLSKCEKSKTEGKGRTEQRRETLKEKIQRGKQLAQIPNLGTHNYVLHNNELHTNESYLYKVDKVCPCVIGKFCSFLVVK